MTRHVHEDAPASDYERRKQPRVQVVYAPNGNGAHRIVWASAGGMAAILVSLLCWNLSTTFGLVVKQSEDRAARMRDHDLLCDIAQHGGIVTRSCDAGH